MPQELEWYLLPARFATAARGHWEPTDRPFAFVIRSHDLRNPYGKDTVSARVRLRREKRGETVRHDAHRHQRGSPEQLTCPLTQDGWVRLKLILKLHRSVLGQRRCIEPQSSGLAKGLGW